MNFKNCTWVSKWKYLGGHLPDGGGTLCHRAWHLPSFLLSRTCFRVYQQALTNPPDNRAQAYTALCKHFRWWIILMNIDVTPRKDSLCKHVTVDYSNLKTASMLLLYSMYGSLDVLLVQSRCWYSYSCTTFRPESNFPAKYNGLPSGK